MHICFPVIIVCREHRKPNSQKCLFGHGVVSAFALGTGHLEWVFTSLSFGGVKEPREGLCEAAWHSL